jgi:hypothetical protein
MLRRVGIPEWGFRPRGKANPSKDDAKAYAPGPGTGLASQARQG